MTELNLPVVKAALPSQVLLPRLASLKARPVSAGLGGAQRPGHEASGLQGESRGVARPPYGS